MRQRQTVACLAGDGVGPELMAEATRTLSHVSRLHSLELVDLHLPFAGEAVTRSGHPLPPETRSGYRDANAVLVATPDQPAFEGVKADLELAWQLARVPVRPSGDVLVIGPVGPWADEAAIRRAFVSAGSRGGHLTSVGTSSAWRELVEAEQERWGGLTVDHLTLGETLVRLSDDPGDLDVIATETHLVAPIADAVAHIAGTPTRMARAWLSADGPGVFAPGTSEASEVAGFGTADPAAMLLTTSLLLAEGLQRRAAARTLSRAVETVLDRNGAAPRGTRDFTDAVIELLPETRNDLEHDEARR
jgi:isocitrate/isopropylmalate dehydrogenase